MLKEIKKQNRGITLIALVITIIVLIILAGVSINLLLGENGLINKAISGKEQYNEASIREKVEMELASLYMEKLNSNSPLTIEEALQALLENGIFESIDIATNSGTIDGNQVVLKYDENGNIVIDEIGEISGIVASYVLDPISYTPDTNVTIKFKVSGEVKSVTKPDTTVVEASNGTVEIDYLVNANGTYTFKVEDNDGNVKHKKIVVNTIDTLAPKDFTITAESTEMGIVITANAEDTEATDTNACSGIDRYEYYVKLSTEEEYTRYETNEIKEIPLGNYCVYAIAYDKAGNDTQSTEIETIYYGSGAVWEKWDVIKNQPYFIREGSFYMATGTRKDVYNNLTVANDGTITLSGKTSANLGATIGRYIEVGDGYGLNISHETLSTGGYRVTYKYFEEVLPVQKGESFKGYIISENKEEFPENGEKDGYWYVKK